MIFSSMKSFKFVSVMIAVLLVSGCVNTTVMTRSEGTAPHKLTSATIEWNGKVKVKYTIGATVRRGEEIPGIDKLRGLGVLSKLLKELSESVPLMVEKELEAAGIEHGEDVILRLTPIKAAHTINAGRSAHVEVSIIGGQDKSEIWSATVRVNASKGENDELLAQKMAQTMSAELKAAGWI